MAVLVGLYVISSDGMAIRVKQEGDIYVIDDDIIVQEVLDVSFSKYVYSGTEEFDALRAEYSVMDNVDGFSWDVLSKVRVKTEVRDYETDAPSTRERVKFIEGNDYDNNWDYFEYKKKAGSLLLSNIQIAKKSLSILLLRQVMTPTLQDISTTPSDYFDIRDQIVDNHGDTILSIVPEFEGLEINILPSDDIVVSNAAGDILYSGWFHSDDQPREDGRLYWNVTMHPAEQWDDWVLSVGGLNQVQEVTNADNTVDYLLESGGSNATFVTEYYYRDDMSPEAWSQMLVSHQRMPDGTFETPLQLVSRLGRVIMMVTVVTMKPCRLFALLLLGTMSLTELIGTGILMSA